MRREQNARIVFNRYVVLGKDILPFVEGELDTLEMRLETWKVKSRSVSLGLNRRIYETSAAL